MGTEFVGNELYGAGRTGIDGLGPYDEPPPSTPLEYGALLAGGFVIGAIGPYWGIKYRLDG